MNEYDHPEMSYRRGFEQGACELLERIDAFLPPAVGKQARDWLLELTSPLARRSTYWRRRRRPESGCQRYWTSTSCPIWVGRTRL